MIVNNIIKKLEQVNATDIKITVERTAWGHHVRLTAKIGGYYDVEVTNQLTDSEHRLSNKQVTSWFKASVVYNFATKPWHDTDDWMTDYCAWTFHDRINQLDRITSRVVEYAR